MERGKKRFASFLFNPSFYISCAYVTFPNGSKTEMVFFALFFFSAAHFIFHIWAGHLNLTQWSGNLLPWLFESIQSYFLRECYALPITPEPNFIWKGGDHPSVWKLIAHDFPRLSEFCTLLIVIRLALWISNPGNKSQVLVWHLKLRAESV